MIAAYGLDLVNRDIAQNCQLPVFVNLPYNIDVDQIISMTENVAYCRDMVPFDGRALAF